MLKNPLSKELEEDLNDLLNNTNSPSTSSMDSNSRMDCFTPNPNFPSNECFSPTESIAINLALLDVFNQTYTPKQQAFFTPTSEPAFRNSPPSSSAACPNMFLDSTMETSKLDQLYDNAPSYYQSPFFSPISQVDSQIYIQDMNQYENPVFLPPLNKNMIPSPTEFQSTSSFYPPPSSSYLQQQSTFSDKQPPATSPATPFPTSIASIVNENSENSAGVGQNDENTQSSNSMKSGIRTRPIPPPSLRISTNVNNPSFSQPSPLFSMPPPSPPTPTSAPPILYPSHLPTFLTSPIYPISAHPYTPAPSLPSLSPSTPLSPNYGNTNAESSNQQKAKRPAKVKPKKQQSPAPPDPKTITVPTTTITASGKPRTIHPAIYKCTFENCPKVFTRPYNLRSHMKIHTGEKLFCCLYCDAKFTRGHDLKRHTRLHTNEKPFECTRCLRRFTRSDALRRHQKVEDCQPLQEGEQVAPEVLERIKKEKEEAKEELMEKEQVLVVLEESGIGIGKDLVQFSY